jgi:BirA family biotin operon repressor/biotin-[acetyl-CoA-carboxylase] ligase
MAQIVASTRRAMHPLRMRIVRHGVVDSTSERAFASLAAGAARHLDAHVAEEQTLGRGRRGARWHSPRGGGVWLSMVLLPPRPLPGAALTIAAGLAALDATRAAGCAQCGLKWPNDVVDARGAKLAGVLVETRGLDPRAPHYVVGVGIDVDIAEFPAALLEERPMTSLALLGCATDRARIEAALLEALPRRVEGIESDPAGLAADFLAALRLAGRMVVADGLRGRLVALELERGLLLRTDEGGERWSPLETTSSLREA